MSTVTIDGSLLNEAMKITGFKREDIVIDKAVRNLIEQYREAPKKEKDSSSLLASIRAKRKPGNWTGDLDDMRTSRFDLP